VRILLHKEACTLAHLHTKNLSSSPDGFLHYQKVYKIKYSQRLHLPLACLGSSSISENGGLSFQAKEHEGPYLSKVSTKAFSSPFFCVFLHFIYFHFLFLLSLELGGDAEKNIFPAC